ncbi:MAG: citrate transporter [Lachnospiraceae bacterium]|nr:citrate transporter [Lachnospiraceae bacterium]
MNNLMRKCIAFVKKETVLSIALILAVISSLIILPDAEYLDYIDFRTLGILFSLMAVMAGLQKIGVFGRIAGKLLEKVKSIRALVLILVLLCFFFSMVITNDVALITFVPFTFTVLKMTGAEQVKKLAVPVVVMQTIAANLGSMLTPIGNPQNLYLYGQSGMGLGEFVWMMLPYSVLSLVLLIIWCFFQKGGTVSVGAMTGKDSVSAHTKELAVYLLLFVFCLLTVARVVPCGITMILVIAAVLRVDRQVLARVDYALLMTFVGFFVFIGNMGRIPAFSSFLESMIAGHEVMTAVISSQVISNVPAALLLSGFTDNYPALIVGTNLGGLGTLIASMASLISFKYMGQEDKERKGAYMIYFTAANLIFLIVLLGYHFVVK